MDYGEGFLIMDQDADQEQPAKNNNPSSPLSYYYDKTSKHSMKFNPKEEPEQVEAREEEPRKPSFEKEGDRANTGQFNVITEEHNLGAGSAETKPRSHQFNNDQTFEPMSKNESPSPKEDKEVDVVDVSHHSGTPERGRNIDLRNSGGDYTVGISAYI